MAALVRDVQLCWLARAVTHVLRRASGLCGVSSARFAAVGAPGGERETAQRVAELVQVLGETGAAVAEADGVATASSFEQLSMLIEGLDGDAKRLLVVVTREMWSAGGDEALAGKGFEMLLVISEKDLLGGSLEWAWSCSLHSLRGAAPDDETLLWVRRPLDQLPSHCGWRIALEVFSWVAPRSVTGGNGSSQTQLEPLFSSAGQLPFQLLSLLLRWTYCHPQVAHELGKKVRRQIELTPSRRTKGDIMNILELGLRIWKSQYPLDSIRACEPGQKTLGSSAKQLEAMAFSNRGLTLGRLSKCQLWDAQKQFYLDRGISAWSSGTVPFGVSSSSFIAAVYARVAVDFLLAQNVDSPPETKNTDANGQRTPNCFVWEAASGSCKFLHHFLLHFGTEVASRRAAFKRRGLVPLVVASDLSEDVLDSRMKMACFRPYLERGLLEFARFDTANFISGQSKGLLQFKWSGRTWMPGSDGPLLLMGNYFFDSLRADVFALAANADDLSAGRCTVREALIESTTLSIAEMELFFGQPFEVTVHTPATIFESSVANIVFDRIISEFIEKNDGGLLSSLILFPTEAIALLSELVSNANEGAVHHPVAILAGDAGFSFREAIPSAFLAMQEGASPMNPPVSLELPQLSPHPDCFCLPVDFELFRFTFEGLCDCIFSSSTKASVSIQTLATPASDTFDVFYATIGQENVGKSGVSFHLEFDAFTPGDCDLLWGLMGADDGAKHFSTTTQLALLTQTAWDFDLFVVLQWPLASQYKASPSTNDRLQLIEAGVRSWRTYYELEEFDGGSTGQPAEARITVQVARWFYG